MCNSFSLLHHLFLSLHLHATITFGGGRPGSCDTDLSGFLICPYHRCNYLHLCPGCQLASAAVLLAPRRAVSGVPKAVSGRPLCALSAAAVARFVARPRVGASVALPSPGPCPPPPALFDLVLGLTDDDQGDGDEDEDDSIDNGDINNSNDNITIT